MTPAEVLSGKFVKLVKLDPLHHTKDLHAGSHGPQQEALWQYLTVGPFSDVNEHQAHLSEFCASDGCFGYVIMDQESSAVLGQIALMRFSAEHKSAEIGYVLFLPALQRTKGGTEALYLMLQHVFDTLNFRRCEWRCNSENVKSEQAALRLGFQREAFLRKHMLVKGSNRDTMIFSLLDDEWPQTKRVLTSWLDDENFNENGIARHSLNYFWESLKSHSN